MPSLSNNGTCLVAHKYLTLSAILCCLITCFLSSFTDSYIGSNGKLYYGIATFKGMYVLNKYDDHSDEHEGKADKDIEVGEKGFEDYKIEWIDFVHAFTSSLVFLVFAISSYEVQRCFFPHPGPNANALMINLPLVVGVFASLVFLIFPTKRRGIGYADVAPGLYPKTKEGVLAVKA